MTLKQLADDLRKTAEERGLKNLEVAELAGIDNSLIGKVYNADRTIGPRNYAKVAHALGRGHLDLSVQDLLPPQE